MSHRLETGGRLIDRKHRVGFRWDGKGYEGFAGDTLASALLARGVTLMGRSFKYHRPRGVVSAGPEEPNALVNLGAGPTLEPNIRATQVELRDGLQAESQNRWPSLEWDVGAVNNAGSKFIPGGFYYKTFKQPRWAWKHVFEPAIRRAAGLGKAPKERDLSEYEHLYLYCDVLVAGGGAAGLLAARRAAEAGARVVLAEQSERWGGRTLVDAEGAIDGQPAGDWIEAQVEALRGMENVTVLSRTTVAACYDHGYAILYERRGDRGEANGPRHRLWRVRAKQVISATGAIERPIAFHQNDLPGVMLASAVRDYIDLWAVAPGERIVVYTTNDDGYRTALKAKEAGLRVPAILDSRADPQGPLVDRARGAGIEIMPRTGINRVLFAGRAAKGIETIPLDDAGGKGRVLDADCIAMAGGWTPVVHLWSHSGGKVMWDEALGLYRPDASKPPRGREGQPVVQVVGSADGAMTLPEVMASAAQGTAEALGRLEMSAPADAPAVDAVEEGAAEPVWLTPSKDGKKAAKHFLDFQNDVTAADVMLAAREGYESVEHAKRYTTLGMATDQGKLSNVNGHAVLGAALGKTIAEVGTTTFRPPYTPISFGSITGSAVGELFKPVRRTPMHGWHEARGAEWEPVGDWRRPYCYPEEGDGDRHDAIHREVLRVRREVGLLDASTLGKLIVKGPDAAELLDRLYTNTMSSLKVGRCRYGLMNDENGFLMDDGVVARLSEDAFLCHTTSGGADRIHAWMEEWLQTEWFDLKAYVANVTEQWAQIAVAGPKARDLLASFETDIDLAALKFMGFAEGTLAGAPVRVFRISFSGELSYELAVPAARAPALWEALMEKAEAMGGGPYGTEALHVLRAEKGFVVIGDETDGTVTAPDVGMGWAVHWKKRDFIGKRAMSRADLTREDRWQLVGLMSEDPDLVLPDGALALAPDRDRRAKRKFGRVTSTYMSPTLGRSIALALIEKGRERFGEVIEIGTGKKTTARAVICDPVFYDRDGERQDV